MLTALLDGIGSLPTAEWLRFSRWGYAAVNAAHILGLALLIGAIAALDLSLIGFRSGDGAAPPATGLARVLVPIAGSGLVLAIATGLALFSVRPQAYAANPVFLAKLAVIALGLANVAAVHWMKPSEHTVLRRITALVSLSGWVATLVLGRLIAFTDN